MVHVSDQRWIKVPGCVDGLGWSRFPAYSMGQPLRPPVRLKVEVEARPSAGTGPTAGHLESAAGNGQLPRHGPVFIGPEAQDKAQPQRDLGIEKALSNMRITQSLYLGIC